MHGWFLAATHFPDTRCHGVSFVGKEAGILDSVNGLRQIRPRLDYVRVEKNSMVDPCRINFPFRKHYLPWPSWLLGKP